MFFKTGGGRRRCKKTLSPSVIDGRFNRSRLRRPTPQNSIDGCATMSKLIHPLLLMIANATDSELARHVQYLKVENQILREKLPKRITISMSERQRLLKYGKAVGSAIKELITIVTPRTFARWVNGDKKSDAPEKEAKPGRPRTSDEIRELVVKLARVCPHRSARTL